jgi:hypothetical protein
MSRGWAVLLCGERGQAGSLRGAIGLRPGKAIEDLALRQLLQPLQGEGRAGTITQQPLQPGAVVAVEAHRGMQREAPAVGPARHGARIGLVEQAGAGEPTQHPSAHLLLHRGEVFRCQRGGLGEMDLTTCDGRVAQLGLEKRPPRRVLGVNTIREARSRVDRFAFVRPSEQRPLEIGDVRVPARGKLATKFHGAVMRGPPAGCCSAP